MRGDAVDHRRVSASRCVASRIDGGGSEDPWLAVVGCARWIGAWHSEIPDHVYFHLIPRAHEFSHP